MTPQQRTIRKLTKQEWERDGFQFHDEGVVWFLIHRRNDGFLYPYDRIGVFPDGGFKMVRHHGKNHANCILDLTNQTEDEE